MSAVLGKVIRRIRLERGMPQTELALRCGITQPYICQIEKGRIPSDRALLNIIDALDLDPADLPSFSRGREK